LPYRRFINRELLPAQCESFAPFAIELFAGCGGMSLGFEAAGFRVCGYEMATDAWRTFRANLNGDCFLETLTTDSQILAGDVLLAGPPCQPFSLTGLMGGQSDQRNGFPVFLAAVQRVQPAAAVLENVPALKTQHLQYFNSLIRRLKKLGYKVQAQILNAADFGVPQKRRRLFVVAHRGSFAFPSPSHTDHNVTVHEALGSMVKRLPAKATLLSKKAMQYVRRYEAKCECRTSRDLICNEPARTLTCRNLAGATGDMIRLKLPDGRRRRLSVREAARLQSFPDWFRFIGAKSSQFVQIGNAIPPLLAKAIALSVYACLSTVESR
jgi:DNA-cytosine methyltransferase